MLPLAFRKPWLTAVALACLLVVVRPAAAQEATGNIDRAKVVGRLQAFERVQQRRIGGRHRGPPS
jgi:hypothetical protein